jgi:glutamine synthetase
MRRWLAGMLATMPGAMSLLSPSVNSYRRLVDITGPPTSVTWGEDNKSVALRTVTREPSSSRIEHRLAASDCNMYAALSALLAGGLVGMDGGLEPPPAFEGMAWALPEGTVEMLPTTIRAAAAALDADAPLREKLGPEAVDYWIGTREWEWVAFHTHGGDPDSVNEFELRRYFEQP